MKKLKLWFRRALRFLQTTPTWVWAVIGTALVAFKLQRFRKKQSMRPPAPPPTSERVRQMVQENSEITQRFIRDRQATIQDLRVVQEDLRKSSADVHKKLENASDEEIMDFFLKDAKSRQKKGPSDDKSN